MERKLLAILAADVVGYSRLMNEDEAGTLATLRSRQKTLIEPRIGEHGGRVVKLMGDGVLAEFASVVHAVECAVAVQRGIAASNANLPPERRMDLRIGVNLGDVMVEDGDIYGDGVNIATRLEQLAEPGGICVCGSTYEQVKHKLKLAYLDIGEQQVKNIDDPIRVFRIDPGALATSRKRPKPGDAPAVRETPLPQNAGGRSDPSRPGIVVLPFENLSADTEQGVLCDGLTSDITTDLSKFSSLFVIAANTAFTYKGRPTRVEEVARALDVRYVLEGSVQQMGERIRINAQLIDAGAGHHLWAQRFDRRTGDLFAVQDEMLGLIVTALAVRLTAAEHERAARKHPASVNAYEAYLRGMHLYSTRSADELAASRAWFDRAVELDPLYARAWGALAYVYVQEWLNGWRDDSVLELAERHAHKAVELDPNDYMPHSFLAFCCLNARNFELAMAEYERAYALNPSDADLLADISEALVYVGRHGEAIQHIQRAMEINPHTPDWYRWDLGWAHYFAKDYGKALAALHQIPRPQPDVRLMLAAVLARLGQTKEAAAEMKRFRKARPGWTVASERLSVRFRDQADEEHWLQGARMAGLPEDDEDAAGTTSGTT
ncbi:MAG TPA: adenylate/guanylate cyclase domain-containing protein [Candidatus Udaeobacter sp.]|nr:adenylate/guanylate cyclase domain-containing protein [Candidatus Udaeobacter sp.]